MLLLGHYDTVYPLGTLATMPCRRVGDKVNDKLSGPGVLDMKSGIALMLHALAALKQWHGRLPRPVTVLLVSDEEVGSDSSRALTESLAKQSAAVLVIEPAQGYEGEPVLLVPASPALLNLSHSPSACCGVTDGCKWDLS